MFFGTQSVTQVIHGSAAPFAFYIAAAEKDAEHIFRIVGHHADDCGNPHPKYGAGAAHGDRVCNTCNIAGSNGCGERGAKRLKLGDGMFVVGFQNIFFLKKASDGFLPHVAKVSKLKKFGDNGHQYAGSD